MVFTHSGRKSRAALWLPTSEDPAENAIPGGIRETGVRYTSSRVGVRRRPTCRYVGGVRQAKSVEMTPYFESQPNLGFRSHLLADPVAAESVVEGSYGDSEQARSLLAVAAGPLERLQDRLPLALLE